MDPSERPRGRRRPLKDPEHFVDYFDQRHDDTDVVRPAEEGDSIYEYIDSPEHPEYGDFVDEEEAQHGLSGEEEEEEDQYPPPKERGYLDHIDFRQEFFARKLCLNCNLLHFQTSGLCHVRVRPVWKHRHDEADKSQPKEEQGLLLLLFT